MTSTRASSRPRRRGSVPLSTGRRSLSASSCWSATDLLSNPRAIPCSGGPAGAGPPGQDEDGAQHHGFPRDGEGVVAHRRPVQCPPDVKEERPGRLVVPLREGPEG